MNYITRNGVLSAALLLSWCLTLAFGFFLLVSMTELSYANERIATMEQEVAEAKEAVIVEAEEVMVEAKVIEEPQLPYSDEEIELIALVTIAEAEGESELGKRLVIDTVLNRVESDGFPDTVEGVVYQANQFTSMWNGRVDRCVVTDKVIELVKEEIVSKVNPDVLYFRAGYFHDFGTPVIAEGNHYFSTK